MIIIEKSNFNSEIEIVIEWQKSKGKGNHYSLTLLGEQFLRENNLVAE